MKIILGSCFLMTCSAFSAQILTQAFNEPVIGDIDKNYRLDTSSYTNGLPVNVTGNNCTWNFAKLAGAFPMVVDSFIAPAAAVGASAYPTASYSQHRDILYSYYKSTANPSQTELLGGYSPSLSLTFTNSAIIAGYPVSYGYNLTDPVSGSFKYNTQGGACNGSITIAADGAGTVNFPNSVSVPNVLRLKSVETLTLSAGIFPVGTFNQTIYNYYKTGKKFPILSINYTTYQLLAGTPTITALVYGSSDYFNVAGIGGYVRDIETITAFPNPFHDHLALISQSPAEESEFLFFNISGQLTLKTSSLTDANLASLPPGIYILETQTRHGTSRQKLIKE